MNSVGPCMVVLSAVVVVVAGVWVVGKVMVGVMLRKVLNPTLLITSAVSLKSTHRGREVRARKSSMRRVPIL